MPDNDSNPETIVLRQDGSRLAWSLAGLADMLPEGDYLLDGDFDTESLELLALAWARRMRSAKICRRCRRR